MKPLLLSGLRHLRRTPGRFLQVVFAVALGVALFVSSYVSISGIERSIHRSAHAMAGNAQWVVIGSGAGGVPESLLSRLRKVPNLVAAPFLRASVTILGEQPEKLQILGVDLQTDAMSRLFGAGRVPKPEAVARMVLVPNSVLVTDRFATERHLQPGSILKAATRTGAAELSVAGTLEDSPIALATGRQLAFMDLHQAEALFGLPGRVDSIEVAGVSEQALKGLVAGYEVRSVDDLSPEAHDALLRIQSLYGLSLVAMLIGCFVVFSSVQVTVLERMRETATFRALGASRVQILSAILLEWLLVGLVGSLAGILLGLSLSSVILRSVTGAVNSMMPLVVGARAELSWRGFAMGVAIGLFTALTAAVIPAVAAVRESPLLALRPHSYRLRNRQRTAFWVGVGILLFGLGVSLTGSTMRTLASIALSFLGLALLMPQAMLVAAGLLRGTVSRIFGFAGLLAADNLRKAPQRTAFNVIALGGALTIVVSTATVVAGFTQSTHQWIRDSLPFDISVTSSDIGNSASSDETLPSSLVAQVARVPGVSFVYGARKSFAPFEHRDVMVIGVPTLTYLEAHRRRGSLGWAHEIAEPQNVAAMRSGRGVFASENLLALSGLQIGESIELPTPSGRQRLQILGAIQDYSWSGGLLVADLDVMNRLWKSTGLSYIDVQVAEPSQIGAVRSRLAALTRNDYAANVTVRSDFIAIADDVLRQSTSGADVQVWLATIIGFLGIGNSLIVGVLQRRREIGLLRAVGMPRRQLQRTVAIEALLIGVSAGLLGTAGGVLGGWMPLRHFTFAVTGYLYPLVIPWSEMAKVFVAATAIAILAAILPIRRITQIPVLTSIAVE